MGTASSWRSSPGCCSASRGEPPGPLSRLLEELAQAPGDDLLAAWQEELRPGDRLDRFEIRREIGRGGFGAVYEAFDGELGRVVAIKTLRPGRSRQELAAGWIRKEAEAVAKLSHPGIVTLHDVCNCASGPYLVMELLEGRTLAERLADGPLPQDEALRVAEGMAQALAHAHKRGVLHRDLKPDNVFLTDDGRVKLLDFGLAHLLGRDDGSSGGTPAYMAPEQARGEVIDERADVYAAAMVLGEMLTGHRPVEPSTPPGPPDGALDARPSAPAAEGDARTKQTRPDAGEAAAPAASGGATTGRIPVPPLLPGVARPLARALVAALAADPSGRPRDGLAWLGALSSARRSLERPRTVRRVAFFASAFLLLGLLVAGVATWRVWRRQVPLGRITVAVADFTNETRDPELDGLSGLLAASLEQSPMLRVLTRSRMWDYAREIGKGATGAIDEPLAREIGRRADARALLLASVRRLGELYVVEMRALDPERDEYLFTVRERAPSKAAVLDLVDRLSERTRVELREPRREVATRQVPVGVAVTSSLEAHAHYFRAQQVMAESLDSDRAREEYGRALAIDPEFAQAHLQLALLIALGEAEGDDADIDIHCGAVLRLGDRIPDRDRRLAEVVSALRQAETAGPAGREKVRAVMRDAVAADPDSKELLALAGQQAVEDEEYDVAVRRLELALRIDPGYGPALIWLSTAYDKVGRNGDAVAAARRAVAARPGPVSYAVLAQSLAINGERDAAVAAVQQVYDSGREVPYYVSEMVWPVHAYAGGWKRAEAELRRWTGPEALPARKFMAWSALSFLLNAQGRAADVRATEIKLRSGARPEFAGWAAAMAEMLEGQDAKAARSFQKAGGVDGAAVVAYLGDLDGAAVLAQTLNAGSVPADLHRGVDAWKRGNPRTAVPVLQGVISRTNDGGAVRYLGELLCEGENPRQGTELLEAWLQRYPSAVNLGTFIFRPRVLLLVAKCLDRQGRHEEARAKVDRFLSDWSSADPGLPLLAEGKALQARLAAGAGAR
jgi:tetratricopeptide (TPR) repeat protein